MPIQSNQAISSARASYEYLSNREESLKTALNRLSRNYVNINRKDETTSGEAIRKLSSRVRIRKLDFYIELVEHWTLQPEPSLSFFKYCLYSDPQITSEALFRFEYHPFDYDESEEEDDVDGREDDADFVNPYESVPHFHANPKLQLKYLPHFYVSKMHYPFRRTTREKIVFGLLQWIQLDLIHRKYKEEREGDELLSTKLY